MKKQAVIQRDHGLPLLSIWLPYSTRSVTA
jgi:hypothetical protein